MLDRYKVVRRVVDVEVSSTGGQIQIVLEKLVDSNGVLLEGVGTGTNFEQSKKRESRVSVIDFINQFEVVGEEGSGDQARLRAQIY